MSHRDRVETTRVAVALVAWEGELASSDGEPSRGALLNLNNESDRARVAGSCSCGVHVFELCFEPSAHEANCAAQGSVVLVCPASDGSSWGSWKVPCHLVALPITGLHRRLCGFIERFSQRPRDQSSPPYQAQTWRDSR